MKYFVNAVSALSFLALLIFVACGGDGGGDDPKTPGESQAELLNGGWSIASVSFDGTSRIDTWGTNFSLTFSGASEGTDQVWGGNFSTTGHDTSNEPDALTVWPSSGTWDFSGATSSDVSSFTRNEDGVTVTIVQVSASSLVVTFTIDDPSGRADAIFDAEWRFELTKEG